MMGSTCRVRDKNGSFFLAMTPPSTWLLAALLALAGPARPDVGLEADGGAPRDRVGLIGLPDIQDSLRVEIRAPGVAPYPAPIDSTDDGRPALVVPVHPDVLGGGEVAVAVFDGDRQLGLVSPFRIAGLPRAPGTLRRAVQVQRESLALEASRLGFELADLRGPIDALPVELWPAAVALGTLERTDNPNAWAGLLDGTAPALGGRAVDWEVADALAAMAGVEEAVAAHQARRAALGPPPSPLRIVEVPVGAPPGPPGRGPAPPDAPRPVYRRVEIADAATLSYFMKLAWENKGTAESGALKLVGDINNLVGVIPTGVTQVGSLVVGTALFAHVERAALKAALYPSALSTPRATFTVSRFDEDFVEPGTWSDYTVYANSGVWNPTETAFKLVAEAAGVVAGAKALGGPASGVFTGLRDMQATNTAKAAAGRLGKTIGSASDTFVGPFWWGPIDLSGESWSEARVVLGGESFMVDPPVQTYFPIELGRGVLQLRPCGSCFPPLLNQGAGTLHHQVEVRPIAILLTPSRGRYKPGRSVPVTATVQFAHDETLEWEVTEGSVVGHGERQTSATVRLPYRNGVVYVTARSTSTTGLRDPAIATEERVGVAGYRVETAEEEEEEITSNTCAYVLDDIDTLWYVARDGDQEVARLTYVFDALHRTPEGFRAVIRVGLSTREGGRWVANPATRIEAVCDRSGLDLSGVIQRGEAPTAAIDGEGQLRGISFPNRPRPGLSVPDATARIRMDVSPESLGRSFDYDLAEELSGLSFGRSEAFDLVFETELRNRQIVGRERITVPGIIGEVSAWKMTADGTGRVRLYGDGVLASLLGDAFNGAPSSAGPVTVWFHRRYGILRQTQAGGRQTSTLELAGIRRR